MPPVTKESFRKKGPATFVIVEDKLVYLTSLTPIFRYGWESQGELEELSVEDFRKYDVLR